MTLLSTFHRRFRKFTQLLERPSLLALHKKGVSPDTFDRFSGRWITSAGFRTIIDIGANRGQFTHLTHALLPEADIFAFEPLPDLYQLLAESTNGVSSIKTFNVGLGRQEGELTFYRNRYADSSSFRPMADLHKQQFPFTDGLDTPLTVPVRTLDAVLGGNELKEKILVKIDVQGFENEVIAGGQAVLDRAAMVIMEVSFQPLYLGAPNFDEIYSTMRDRGYFFQGFVDQLIGPLDGAALQGDAIFAR